MKWLTVAGLVLATSSVFAAEKMQFWNQTAHEMTGVYLAPAGTQAFGANQALNDPDKSVSGDERLDITGVAPGRYDVKLVDTKGRTCLVRNVMVKPHVKVAFAIEESQLTNCR
jgi:hypothetical protein